MYSVFLTFGVTLALIPRSHVIICYVLTHINLNDYTFLGGICLLIWYLALLFIKTHSSVYQYVQNVLCTKYTVQYIHYMRTSLHLPKQTLALKLEAKTEREI